MLDEDEDISLAKAAQVSLDDAKAKKIADEPKAFQNRMGVTPEDAQASAAAGYDNDAFMQPGEPDERVEEEQSDVVMAEADGDNETVSVK